MNTSQIKFNNNLKYQSLKLNFCPTKIKENSQDFKGKKQLLPDIAGRSRYPII